MRIRFELWGHVHGTCFSSIHNNCLQTPRIVLSTFYFINMPVLVSLSLPADACVPRLTRSANIGTII